MHHPLFKQKNDIYTDMVTDITKNQLIKQETKSCIMATTTISTYACFKICSCRLYKWGAHLMWMVVVTFFFFLSVFIKIYTVNYVNLSTGSQLD